MCPILLLGFFFVFPLLLPAPTCLGQEGVEKALRRLRESVDKFEANFHRAINDYGRVGHVRTPLDQLASHQFRLDDQSAVDFPAAVAQAEVRLQAFFNAKAAALRRLVTAAEQAASQMDVDEVLDERGLPDRECVQHLRLLNRSSVKNEAAWKSQQPRPGVHVATEAYKCSAPVARDFNWTNQQALDEQMAENARLDPTLARQYVGTYNGVTRLFPGFHWDIGPEQFSVDLFDPRFRPWFVAAESAPRDVLFLADFSGSARGLNAHLIKTSVMAVLQTLSPNDFFSGIWYNSRRERLLANCTVGADGFIQATSRNKLLFRRFLDRVEERDQATLPAALEMSFGDFLRQQNVTSGAEAQSPGAAPRRSGGHQLVLLFTDGIEFWPTEEVHRYQFDHPNEPIRVFGHSVGYGRGPQAALAWLTCQTRAGPAQAVVGTIAEIRLKAREHLRKLNELLALVYRDKASNAENRPISWFPPYMDVQRGGPVLSISMPVLGPQPSAYQDLDVARDRVRAGRQPVKLDGFLAVAGLDMSFGALATALALEGEANPEQAYAFLVDNNGIVFFHPRLQTPPAGTFAVRKTLCHRLSTLLRSNTRVPFSRADELILQQMGYLDSVGQLDILELEQHRDTGLWQQFRTNLVLGRCGQTLEDDQWQLRCFAIRGTPLVAGFVLRKGRPKVVMRETPDLEDPFELAERLRTSLMPDEEAESGVLNSSSQMPSSVAVLLRDDQVQQWELSKALSATNPVSRFGQLLQLLPRAHPLWLTHLSALGPDTLFPAWASKWPRNESSNSNNNNNNVCPSKPPFVSAFLELRSAALLGRPALMAAFPRCELPSIKSFLRSTAGQEDSASATKMAVHVDSAKDGLLTVEQPLGQMDGRQALARVGVQLRGHYLQQKLLRALQQTSEGWAECLGGQRKCLLLNADSFVLATSATAGQSTPLAYRPVHLSLEEPELFAELVGRGLIRKISWRDPTGLCPMVMEMRQRQQHFPAHYYMTALPDHGQASSALSSLLPSALGQLLGLLPTWMALMFPAIPVLALPGSVDHHIMPLEDVECEIEPQPELLEHCTLERGRFRLRARTKERTGGDAQGKTTALWLREKSCNRTVGILPFGHSELFLVLLDGLCHSKASAPPPSSPLFVPQMQVPNCNLTQNSLGLVRRARADLDYTRAHPKEFNPICASGSVGRGAVVLTLLLITFAHSILFIALDFNPKLLIFYI